MGLFDFLRRRKPGSEDHVAKVNMDTSKLTRKDFEFLITGDINISPEDFDRIMKPNTIAWTATIKNDCTYYQVGQDEFSYSWEIPGIQMTFNKEISFQKAKDIADQVIENIKASGQDAQLVILDKTETYRYG